MCICVALGPSFGIWTLHSHLKCLKETAPAASWIGVCIFSIWLFPTHVTQMKLCLHSEAGTSSQINLGPKFSELHWMKSLFWHDLGVTHKLDMHVFLIIELKVIVCTKHSKVLKRHWFNIQELLNLNRQMFEVFKMIFITVTLLWLSKK